MIIIIFLKYLLNMKLINRFFVTMMTLVCVISSFAQKRGEDVPVQHLESRYMKLNSEVMQVYKELDSIFPLRYLANESPAKCSYWVNYNFVSRGEFEKYKPWVESLIARLGKVDGYRRTCSVTDSADVYKHVLSVNVVTPNNIQKDYFAVSLSNEWVSFYYDACIEGEDYGSTGSLDDLGAQPRKDIADAMDRLLNKYVNRKGVRKDSVYYDDHNKSYQYVSFKAEGQGKSSGARYVVPGCDESDYAKFRNAIRSYSVVCPVRTACNDMYWQYDVSAIAIARPGNQQPLMVAAALKGNNLYLMRAEGCDGKSFLPRAWTEDDAVWKMKDVYKLDARKPLEPPMVK